MTGWTIRDALPGHRAAIGDYQCDALQAVAWGDAPATHRLVCADAFGGL